MAGVGYSALGRWGGALTRRPLPVEDPLLETLAPADRQLLAHTWLSRAAMERRVADAFEVIRAALVRRGAPEQLVELAARAIDDEYRHTELSRVVASRFAATELAMPERLALEVPRHRGASPELRDTLFIVGQCVLNETTASAFLETCLQHARGTLARSALRELLSDEIDHGRIGWAHLASLPKRTRLELSPWLLPMAFLNLRIWREYSPESAAHSDALTEHGVPPHALLNAALVSALTDLIIPGFKELGIDTRALDAWLAAGADTERAPTHLVRA